MILVEIGVRLTRKVGYNEEQNEEAMNTNLYLLKEKQSKSQVKLVAYKKIFQFKVHKKNFNARDLILKKIFVADKEVSSSLLGPKWEEQYI